MFIYIGKPHRLLCPQTRKQWRLMKHLRQLSISDYYYDGASYQSIKCYNQLLELGYAYLYCDAVGMTLIALYKEGRAALNLGHCSGRR
jgi:hypothetical protein